MLKLWRCRKSIWRCRKNHSCIYISIDNIPIMCNKGPTHKSIKILCMSADPCDSSWNM